MLKISSLLDAIANKLESKGLMDEAFDIDVIANTLEANYAEVEKQLDEAYKRNAPQSEIDHLETELAKWVSEGGHDVSEEDMMGHIPATSEGYSIDEALINLYHQYLNAGNKSITPYDRQEIIDIMRGEINDPVHKLWTVGNLTDQQILDAAKDAYENRRSLLQRKKLQPGIHSTPDEALKSLGDIRGSLKIKNI